MSKLAKASPPVALLKVEEARRLLAIAVVDGRREDVKEIRDRAEAARVYLKNKRGRGQEAANSAGTVVVLASAALHQLYEKERKAGGPGRGKKNGESADLLGRGAFAKEVEVEERDLRRWHLLAEAEKAQRLDDAVARAAATGHGVTPTTVMRALTAVSAHHGYDGDEWYTPADLITRVRAVLGEIDLDPASNAHAQATVRARAFYAKADDGLTRPWLGRVFCNPPYSTKLIGAFTAKLLEEFDAGRTTAAIYLVNNCTDADWQQSLLRRFPACFPDGRIAFLQATGQKFPTRQGQAIFYLGPAAERFAQHFDPEIGTVVRRFP